MELKTIPMNRSGHCPHLSAPLLELQPASRVLVQIQESTGNTESGAGVERC